MKVKNILKFKALMLISCFAYGAAGGGAGTSVALRAAELARMQKQAADEAAAAAAEALREEERRAVYDGAMAASAAAAAASSAALRGRIHVATVGERERRAAERAPLVVARDAAVAARDGLEATLAYQAMTNGQKFDARSAAEQAVFDANTALRNFDRRNRVAAGVGMRDAIARTTGDASPLGVGETYASRTERYTEANISLITDVFTQITNAQSFAQETIAQIQDLLKGRTLTIKEINRLYTAARSHYIKALESKERVESDEFRASRAELERRSLDLKDTYGRLVIIIRALGPEYQELIRDLDDLGVGAAVGGAGGGGA